MLRNHPKTYDTVPCPAKTKNRLDKNRNTMTNHARMPKATKNRLQNAVMHPYSPEPKWGKRSLIPPSSATSYSSPAARHFATNRSG